MRTGLFVLLLVAATATTVAIAQQPATAPKSAAAPAADDGKLDGQFLDLLSQIAATRLERAQQLNAQVQGTFTPDDIALFKLQLNAFSNLGQDVNKTGQVSWFSMLMQLAQASKISADLEARRAMELQQRSPQAISAADLKMAQLRAKLADVNVQRGVAVAGKSADDQQNWALQFLFVEIQSLQDRVRNLEERE